MANSLLIHWMATSLPRSSERRPSSASEERKVRSALRRATWMESKPSAMRPFVCCAQASDAIRNTTSIRMKRCYRTGAGGGRVACTKGARLESEAYSRKCAPIEKILAYTVLQAEPRPGYPLGPERWLCAWPANAPLRSRLRLGFHVRPLLCRALAAAPPPPGTGALDACHAPQILTAPRGAGQRIGARYGRVHVLLEYRPSVEAGGLQFADHTRQIHIPLAEFAEDAEADRIQEPKLIAPHLVQHLAPDVFQMQMPDSLCLGTRKLHRVAATVHIVAGIQANAQQVGVGRFQQARHFAGRFHVSAGMVMEHAAHADFLRALGDAADQLGGILPLSGSETVAFPGIPGQGHSLLAHLVRQHEKRRAVGRQQAGDFQRRPHAFPMLFRTAQRQRDKRPQQGHVPLCQFPLQLFRIGGQETVRDRKSVG